MGLILVLIWVVPIWFQFGSNLGGFNFSDVAGLVWVLLLLGFVSHLWVLFSANFSYIVGLVWV